MESKIKIGNGMKLKGLKSRDQQKYLVLLSNQVVIIDNEWDAMKRARMSGKPVVEMLPVPRSKKKVHYTTLNHLLEANENKETR